MQLLKCMQSMIVLFKMTLNTNVFLNFFRIELLIIFHDKCNVKCQNYLGAFSSTLETVGINKNIFRGT